MSNAIPVSMESFQNLLTMLSPDVSVCVRGRHAIGKSEGVYQAAAQMRSDFYKDPANAKLYDWEYDKGLPVVERRLSQMTEGDTIGIPKLTEGQRSTQFLPCDWLIQAVDQPVVLFLDERNRALPGVKQAIFQLTDSKRFYGHTLHPETRIVIAENIGDEYSVESCDPAEISRCATVELSPSVDEWFTYAKPRVHGILYAFLRQNPALLEHTGVYEPNRKYPDRRSWMKLDKELTRLGLLDTENPSQMLYAISGAFVGSAVASRFDKFVREFEREVSAKEILTNWTKARAKIQGIKSTEIIPAETYIECIEKIEDYAKKNRLTDKNLDNLTAFVSDMPGELMLRVWSILSKVGAELGDPAETIRYMKHFIKHQKPKLLRVTGNYVGDETASDSENESAAAEAEKTESVPAPKKAKKKGKK